MALQPLGTEGQRLPASNNPIYQLTQFSIPVGLGLKFAISDSWNIGFELGSRLTFTDYLDDVSTTYASDNELLETQGELALALANRSRTPKLGGEGRGDAEDKDWYIMGGLSISFNLSETVFSGFSGRSKTGCSLF